MATKSLLLLALSAVAVSAKQCAQFDTSWNLYLFGGESDVSLGQNTTWDSPSPETLTTSGRPPWTGNNTLCLLSQYNNALYVLDADASNPSDIYIFNFDAKSWSTQSTSSAPDLSTGSTVLDHDTNAFYTLPAGSSSSMYTLDFSTITNSAGSSSLAWEVVSAPSFSMDNYNPVMAEASNHINFFGVPSVAAGSANLFVIHYSYFQPDVQSYPTTNSGTSFPDSHGVAISVPFASNDTPDQMVFIPDSFENTFVVTHWTNPGDYSSTADEPSGISSLINSTQLLPAPSTQDTSASYAASDTALVQFTSSGEVYYITSAFSQGSGFDVASSASWTKSGYSASGLSGSSNSTSSDSTSSSTASGSGTAAAGSTASSTGAGSSGTGSASGSSASASSTGSSSSSGAGLKLSTDGKILAVGTLAGLLGGLLSLL